MSSKRKSRGSDAVLETPDSKRQKAVEEETAEGTYEQGITLLNHLKVAKDKRNHSIATEFETLPDKSNDPDYYEAIQLPIALDTIERKLEKKGYPTLTSLESDFKRMVANAKSYNDKSSEIVADAEKIRKLVSNFMVKKNPAYKDPEYSAFPTPIPGDAEDQGPTSGRKRTKIQGQEDEPEKAVESPIETPRENRRTLKLRAPRQTRSQEQPPTLPKQEVDEDEEEKADVEEEEEDDDDEEEEAVEVEDEEEEEEEEDEDEGEENTEDAEESFEGKTFQQAQQKMITELMERIDDDGTEIAGPFLNLPPRSLKDYYQAIKYPVSLKAVQKRIRGIRGRDVATGVSHFKTWQALAEELSFVWDNARAYNEDGSEIFEAANRMEVYFKKRLEDAKAAVPEPSQPKVTLRMGNKDAEPTARIKLNLSSKSPATEPEVVQADKEASKRQQDLVRSVSAPRPSTSESRQRASSEVQPSVNGHSVNGVKAEVAASQSPAAVGRQGSAASEAIPVRNGSVPPTANQASASPMPAPQKPAPPAPKDPYEQRTRGEGKGLADALFKSLTVVSNPSVYAANKCMRFDFYPLPTLTQQTAAIHLEPGHTQFLVAVLLPTTLSQRPHKYVLKLNRQMLGPTPSHHIEGADPRSFIYEVAFVPGMVNSLELEVLVSLSTRGNPKHGSASEYEYERCSIFANVFAA